MVVESFQICTQSTVSYTNTVQFMIARQTGREKPLKDINLCRERCHLFMNKTIATCKVSYWQYINFYLWTLPSSALP